MTALHRQPPLVIASQTSDQGVVVGDADGCGCVVAQRQEYGSLRPLAMGLLHRSTMVGVRKPVSISHGSAYVG